jgi:hypothetical protein
MLNGRMLNLLLKEQIRQIICEPEVKIRDNFTNMEDLSQREDINKLREYLKQFP